LSFFIWKNKKFLTSFLPTTNGKTSEISLLDKFKEVLAEVEELKKKTNISSQNIKGLTLDGLGHTQKVFLSRYNPYGDTGGDQSFTTVFLDGKGTGIMLTSLHTRAGTRIYAKNIIDGKSEIGLSKEETEILKQALEN